MALDCFSNLVGIDKTCSTTPSDSGMYLNSLPGMSLNVMDAAANSEVANGIKLLQDEVIPFACEELLQDLRVYIKPRYYQRTILETDRRGHVLENLINVGITAGQYAGIKVEIDQRGNMAFQLNSVSFIAQSAVTTDVFVIDLMQGKIVSTTSITTIADELVEIQLNEEYTVGQNETLQLLICVDASVVATRKTVLSPKGCGGCGHQYDYCKRGFITMHSVQLPIAGTLTNTNTTGVNNTNGIQINYSVNCSLDGFLCSLGSNIAHILRYKIGVLTMMELINSRRLNSIVTIDNKTNVELMDWYESQYQTYLTREMDGIILTDRTCFECRTAAKYETALP